MNGKWVEKNNVNHSAVFVFRARKFDMRSHHHLPVAIEKFDCFDARFVFLSTDVCRFTYFLPRQNQYLALSLCTHRILVSDEDARLASPALQSYTWPSHLDTCRTRTLHILKRTAHCTTQSPSILTTTQFFSSKRQLRFMFFFHTTRNCLFIRNCFAFYVHDAMANAFFM